MPQRSGLKSLSPDKSKWWFTIVAQDETLAALDDAWANSEFTENWKIQHSLRHPERPGNSDDDHTNGTSQGEAAAPVEGECPEQGYAEAPSDLTSLVTVVHDPLPSLNLAEDDQSLQPAQHSLELQDDNSSYSTVPVPSSAKRLEPGCTLDLDSPERQCAARECG